MNMTRRLSPIAFVLGAAMLAGGAHAQTVKIAIAGPMTGPVTQYGDMVKEGATTAVEMTNAAGGINGKKIELVAVDDYGNAAPDEQGGCALVCWVLSRSHRVVGLQEARHPRQRSASVAEREKNDKEEATKPINFANFGNIANFGAIFTFCYFSAAS